MALFKRLKFKDYVTVRPSLGRRAANFGVRSVAVIAVTISAVSGIALIVEPRDVDAAVKDWHEVVAAGDQETAALVATLNEPGSRALLADPFFDGDAWATFRTAVAEEDAAQIRAMREQVIHESAMLIWPQQRERMLDLANTITLSLDSGTRANLYAVKAWEVVCSGGDIAKITPMFELGTDGLADNVISVSKGHCAPDVTPR